MRCKRQARRSRPRLVTQAALPTPPAPAKPPSKPEPKDTSLDFVNDSLKSISVAWDADELKKRAHPLLLDAVSKSGITIEDYFRMLRKLGLRRKTLSAPCRGRFPPPACRREPPPTNISATRNTRTARPSSMSGYAAKARTALGRSPCSRSTRRFLPLRRRPPTPMPPKTEDTEYAR